MVLQRNAQVPIWGSANAGESVTVGFDDRTYTDTAGPSGRWRVILPAMEAGGPHEMTIRSRKDTIRVEDVLVGDVWICSGQSNMAWPVSGVKNADQEIAAANDRSIRHFDVPRSWARTPSARLAGGEWEPAVPKYVGDFTAVGYFFARELRSEVDVPIGLINTSWGGSRIEPWMSAEALDLTSQPADSDVRRRHTQATQTIDRLRSRLGPLSPLIARSPSDDRGSTGRPHWAAPTLDDTNWKTHRVPRTWEEAGYEGLDGVVWYRRTFHLSREAASDTARLSLGPIDDADTTWVNGHKIGHTEGRRISRQYTVAPSALSPGTNVLAVRVRDHGGNGGFQGSADSLHLDVKGRKQSLAGPWKLRVGALSMAMNRVPTFLYNKMLHPLLPYPISGVLWYQGEANTTADGAYEYRHYFKDLIRSWREDWDQGTFPFLYVQLANFDPGSKPFDGTWALLRESQSAALSVPNTAQAVTIDIGNPDNIHPRNKQDVGRRLSLAARALEYGDDLVYSGPVYQGHRVDEGRILLHFDHVGSGLVARDTELRGFTIAGPDRQFVRGEAKIEGDRVIVSSDQVDTPVAVRYAWADNPERANLYNQERLPASPFRTDTWPIPTESPSSR